MEYECDVCGEEIDPDDEVQASFAILEDDETVCALCNSDFAE